MSLFGSRLARVAARVVLVCAGLTMGLGLAEVGLRAFGRAPEDLRGLHEVRPDRPWIYGLRPGAEGQLHGSGGVHYAVNADGFRGPRRARPKPPGTFRIAAVGDSVTFGYAVEEEDTYTTGLEARLGAMAPSAPIEVVNLGVGGYNPYLEAALFADVGVTWAPDLVLVQFCVNDLNDPTIHFNASAQKLLAIPDAAFPDPSRRHPPPPAPAPVLRACLALRTCAALRSALTVPEIPDAGMLTAAFAFHDDPSAQELAWLGERYEDIRRAAERAGARMVVAVFPYRAQVDPAAPDRLQARIGELGRAHGWPVIDLLSAFRRAARETKAPLFWDHYHPTPAGHRVAAEALARALACAGLVPVPTPADCG